MHIFRLWQTFLDNVNPLIKIFHAPTVQQQVLDASADLAKVSKRMEVLMFGIYATAVNSLDEQEVKTIFCEEKSILLNRYQSGCRQALLRAGFLRSSDMTILQGFVLYLVALPSPTLSSHLITSQTSGLNFAIDPRALYCLTGITVRIAQRMGLNVDGTSYGLQPFEVEMRRRLWWQIILLDSRVGELSGAGPSLHMHMWTTKLPSNVNDSSLFPDMREPPVEHPGVTEMLFVLQKYEIAQFVHHTKRACGPTDHKDGMIDSFEEMLENKYLKYCDAQVPMHHISMLMAKIGMCRLRIGPRHPHLLSVKGNDLSDEEKEKLFILSLTMLENHHQMMCAKNLVRFLWHIYTNFPFPAHVYILCALRYRTTGGLADRAWQQMSDNFDRRYKSDMKGRVKRGSQLQMALANLTLKAWDAREAALQVFQPCTPTPKFILGMREELASRKSPGSTTQSDTPQAPLGDAFGTQLEDAYQWLNQQPLSAQGFDQSGMPVPMPDSSSMDWSFWNGYLQVPMPTGFDNSMTPGFYQT
jgi:hypothetical protein